MSYPNHARPIEVKIIDRIIDRALALGYSISVLDEEEEVVNKSRDKDKITDDVHATDVTVLEFYTELGQRLGMICFIHGNDEDVVHDCTDNIFMRELWDEQSV